jgi:predicted  nucleic acid-binding Zn-ribbon protein
MDEVVLEYRVNGLRREVKDLKMEKDKLKNELADLRAEIWNVHYKLCDKKSELESVKMNLYSQKLCNEVLNDLFDKSTYDNCQK